MKKAYEAWKSDVQRFGLNSEAKQAQSVDIDNPLNSNIDGSFGSKEKLKFENTSIVEDYCGKFVDAQPNHIQIILLNLLNK